MSVNEGGVEGVTSFPKRPVPCPGTGLVRASKEERYPATPARLEPGAMKHLPSSGGAANEGGAEGQTAFRRTTPPAAPATTARAEWDGSHGDESIVAGETDEPTV